MRILLAAATSFELKTLMEQPPAGVRPVITGVGLVPATYHLSRAIATHSPDLVIQAGIAGCFDPARSLGEVIAVSEEVLADVGVEEHGQFKDLGDLGLQDPNEPPFQGGRLPNPHLTRFAGLPTGRSISVSEITTRPDRIRHYKDRYAPLVESMEGAALHYVCLKENIPFLQVRALSNYIGERDKTRWKIAPALANLQQAITQLLNEQR
ncbi:futalosine hydrolase [Dinghuibacter silviterrae]|uniref:Futalosine hydrolase n=1 Tax=Dinghuibacter silviterrae TaxID=1539049 RepID=A0A4R8DF49_9BACT|nr:futalosine hydrolase [Dinghuibacter silviterrae]TDW95696.1 futalosine hydrolase [Dinghuibacter silviterrae]